MYNCLVHNVLVLLAQVRYKGETYDAERAQNEMTTINKGGVYYVLDNKDEMEHSMSRPPPKAERTNEDTDRYVWFPLSGDLAVLPN